MSIEDIVLSDLLWFGPKKLKNANEVLVKTDIERSSKEQEEKVLQVVMISHVIQSDTSWTCNLRQLFLMLKV